jgi:hypothetical protein
MPSPAPAAHPADASPALPASSIWPSPPGTRRPAVAPSPRGRTTSSCVRSPYSRPRSRPPRPAPRPESPAASSARPTGPCRPSSRHPHIGQGHLHRGARQRRRRTGQTGEVISRVAAHHRRPAGWEADEQPLRAIAAIPSSIEGLFKLQWAMFLISLLLPGGSGAAEPYSAVLVVDGA